MVTIEYSNSEVKNCSKTEIVDDYTAERLFLKLSYGSINPALLDEGPYTMTGLSIQDEESQIIYDTVTFIP